MARQSLQEELQNLIGTTKTTQTGARKKLAKLYCNEIVLHTVDLTEAIFEKYETDTKRPIKLPSQKEIFKKGAKIFVRTVRENLRSRRKLVTWENTHVATFKGGLVIYLIGPKLTFESSAWKKIITKDVDGARDTMERFINKKFEKRWGEGQTVVPELNAKGFATGHHGGTIGSDPKTTYATGAITNEAQVRTSKVDKNLATVELDEFDPSIVASYSDIFWWNMMDVINQNYDLLWDVTQNTRRPNRQATMPGGLDDAYIYRIVYGKVSANIMNPYDRSGRTKYRVNKEMAKLVTQAKQVTEKQVRAYIKANIGVYPDLEGSPSPKDRVRKLAAETVVNALSHEVSKSKGAVTVTTKSEKAKSGTRKTIVKGKTGRRKVQSGSKKGSRTKKIKGKRAVPWRNRGGINPVGLAELLNKTLAKELMKNMGPYPRRLENRSGRFARSAEVTNIAPLPNSIEIQYTYQKDPYAVFEPENGNAMSSWGRDPKRLIGGTIREIAQSIMGTRFGLVRTKRV